MHAQESTTGERARSQTKVGDFCVTRSAGRSDHPADISLGKVVAFEQQRLARCSSQRVSEDIAEIEASGMASFSESTVRSSCLRDMVRAHGAPADVRFRNHLVEFAPAGLPFPRLDAQGRFKQGSA